MGGITGSSSITTGNGLSGLGTAVSPAVVAAPTFNTVGSYALLINAFGNAIAAGSNYSVGTGNGQLTLARHRGIDGFDTGSGISGTWKALSTTNGASLGVVLGVRVA